MTLTNSNIVAGQVDEAINQAVGDIWPGAHVAVTQYDAVRRVWLFDITVPQIPTVSVTDAALTQPGALNDLIGMAEDAVRVAKAKLLTAWGFGEVEIGGVLMSTEQFEAARRPLLETPGVTA